MVDKVICVVVVLFLVALAIGSPVIDDTQSNIDNLVYTSGPSNIEESLLKKLNTKCSNQDISACMMLKLVTYFNKMMKKSSIEFGNIEITQTSTETIATESARSLNSDNMSDEDQLSHVVADKIYTFLKTRSLKWKVIDGADMVVSGNGAQDGSLNLGVSFRPTSNNGDARKKKDNNMGPIIAAAIMKIGLLKALAFKALVLLVGKALLVSKLALVLAAVIGLKKLLHSEKHVTYEVVAHPQHEHHDVHHESHHDHGHESYGGWGRSFNAQNVAYRKQIPEN